MRVLFITLVCYFFLAQAKAGWEPEDEICAKKLNIERSVMEEFVNELLHEENDETYNKYSECYWNEKKLLNDDGSVNWEHVKEVFKVVQLPAKTVESVVDKCKEKNFSGKDVGQTVVKIQNCIVKYLFVQ